MYDYFMNLHQKLYQLFILGLKGKNAESALEKGLGGVIFFKDDIISSDDFKNLIKNLKTHALIPPFLSIDQEGGRVERTENIHGCKKYLSAKFAFEKGEKFLAEQTQMIAGELKDYGINLNFAPCVDVNTNPNNPIIDERAFSSNPEEVVAGGKIVSEIYRKNGIIPCLKHFPGHGDADTDSHLALPSVKFSENHVKPFKELINCEMIMIAHLQCDYFGELPTSLNKNAINYLRETLGYKGVIISDDMVMQALDKFGEVEACETAIRAGVNLFIYRFSDEKTLNIIETLAQKAQNDEELTTQIEKSYERVRDLKRFL
jgi:beta-N-acetylhexosaminidase